MTFVDYTKQELQGSYGHDKIDSLTVTGMAVVPVRDYCKQNYSNWSNDRVKSEMYINIKNILYSDDGTQIILGTTKLGDEYSDDLLVALYYNGSAGKFKFYPVLNELRNEFKDPNPVVENFIKDAKSGYDVYLTPFMWTAYMYGRHTQYKFDTK